MKTFPRYENIKFGSYHVNSRLLLEIWLTLWQTTFTSGYTTTKWSERINEYRYPRDKYVVLCNSQSIGGCLTADDLTLFCYLVQDHRRTRLKTIKKLRPNVSFKNMEKISGSNYPGVKLNIYRLGSVSNFWQRSDVMKFILVNGRAIEHWVVWNLKSFSEIISKSRPSSRGG